jgi:hypothetical protein
MIKRITLLFLTMLCLIFFVNLIIDPARLIKFNNYVADEKKIAEILLTGNNAGIPVEKIGFDERLFRKFIFEKKRKLDESVIFGSSRVRYLSSKAFNNEFHYVDAMNAATLEDLLVFSYLRKKFGLLPKKLYIALDPWMIEKNNDYIRLPQVSYPDEFVNAVDYFNFHLPENSAKAYKILVNEYNNFFQVNISNIILEPVLVGNFQTVAVGRMPFDGPLQFTFEGSISKGTHYFAWKVFLNDSLVDEGSYLDNNRRSPAPHELRTFTTNRFEAKKGDLVTVQMSHADGNGVPVGVGNQQYIVKNLSAQLRCNDTLAGEYKSWINCNRYLQLNFYQRFFPLLKEMLSPAYFQQSLKSLFSPAIETLSECKVLDSKFRWISCSDGGVPTTSLFYTAEESKRVDNIVRTIDDKLIPLKLIDTNSLALLKQLTDFYIRNGVSVTYVLIPVHPFSYAKWAMEGDSRGFILAETTYRKFAYDNRIQIVGSYDPAKVGCQITDFADWVHPLPRCTNLIADELKKAPSSSALHK